MLGLDVCVCSLSLCRKTHRAQLAEGMGAIKPASNGKAATSRSVGMVSPIGTTTSMYARAHTHTNASCVYEPGNTRNYTHDVTLEAAMRLSFSRVRALVKELRGRLFVSNWCDWLCRGVEAHQQYDSM